MNFNAACFGHGKNVCIQSCWLVMANLEIYHQANTRKSISIAVFQSTLQSYNAPSRQASILHTVLVLDREGVALRRDLWRTSLLR